MYWPLYALGFEKCIFKRCGQFNLKGNTGNNNRNLCNVIFLFILGLKNGFKL